MGLGETQRGQKVNADDLITGAFLLTDECTSVHIVSKYCTDRKSNDSLNNTSQYKPLRFHSSATAISTGKLRAPRGKESRGVRGRTLHQSSD